MPKQFIFILLCLSALLSCRQTNQFDNRYRIVFKEDYWATIDLKSNLLKVDFDSLKFTDTLKFTTSDIQELAEVFNSSELASTKGSIQYDPRFTITEPSFYQTIEIYKDNKPVSNVKINYQCKTEFWPFGVRYEAIKFRNIITRILKNNEKYIKAKTRYQKYMNDHRGRYLYL
ncbi:hypothetical protein [Mucilaginibacter sp. dw_454]|uniref:hypothetical protein n=1 Tax=Mucilaginibacter sp. dw_454 TaxID=2720079 RepID=UPI001BD27912|nr:hypothetical protein [Mucilaginibacter sp. dw_454]